MLCSLFLTLCSDIVVKKFAIEHLVWNGTCPEMHINIIPVSHVLTEWSYTDECVVNVCILKTPSE